MSLHYTLTIAPVHLDTLAKRAARWHMLISGGGTRVNIDKCLDWAASAIRKHGSSKYGDYLLITTLMGFSNIIRRLGHWCRFIISQQSNASCISPRWGYNWESILHVQILHGLASVLSIWNKYPVVTRRHVIHYSDVIMYAMSSQIIGVSNVWSTTFSGTHKRKIKAPPHWPFSGETTGDRWIPHTKGQWRWKYFHLMTSSWKYSTEEGGILMPSDNIKSYRIQSIFGLYYFINVWLKVKWNWLRLTGMHMQVNFQ